MPIAKFTSFKPCQVCGKFIHPGQSISRSGWEWVHSDCIQLGDQFSSTIKMIEDTHRSSLGMSCNEYDVSYSLSDALNWALNKNLLSEDFFEKIKKSPRYKSIWNYVPD